MTAVEFWYPNYSEESMAELESIIKELKPFYEQLHAYIRFKLLTRYGVGVVKPNGPIPESTSNFFHERPFGLSYTRYSVPSYTKGLCHWAQ